MGGIAVRNISFPEGSGFRFSGAGPDRELRV
jgi:hypothetical protein